MINPWSNKVVNSLCSIFLQNISTEDKKSYSLFLFLCTVLWGFVIFHLSFSVFAWNTTSAIGRVKTKARPFTMVESLFCTRHYEWWIVSVIVRRVAHLYTHRFTHKQTITHTRAVPLRTCVHSMWKCWHQQGHMLACAHAHLLLCEVAAGDNEWALHFLPHLLVCLVLVKNQARGHHTVRVRA